MNVADEIGKLNKLKEEGALTEEEFQKAKTSLLSKNDAPGEKFKKAVDDVATDTNMWGMFIHVSQFLGYSALPVAGLILPIVLWQVKKDESDVIDRHGKIVANWILTEFIMLLVSFALMPVVIGFFLFIGVCVLAVVFPIIGAVKANNGEVWAYPLSIQFFKLDKIAAHCATPASTTVQSMPPEAPSSPELRKTPAENES